MMSAPCFPNILEASMAKKKSAGKSTPARKKAAKKRRPTTTPTESVSTSVDNGQGRADLVQTEFLKRHDIPDVCLKAAQEWEDARFAAGKATDKRETKLKNMVALNKEHGVDRVPIQRHTKKGTKTKIVHMFEKDAVEVEDLPAD